MQQPSRLGMSCAYGWAGMRVPIAGDALDWRVKAGKPVSNFEGSPINGHGYTKPEVGLPFLSPMSCRLAAVLGDKNYDRS